MTILFGSGLIAIAYASRIWGSLVPLFIGGIPTAWYLLHIQARVRRLASQPTQRNHVFLLNLAVGFCILVAWCVVLFT